MYDVSAKQALFSERATALRPPASVEKLYTATTALQRLGPTARLSTTVLGVGALNPGGVWEGNLYLRGGGDPTFGTSAFIHSHYGARGASISTLAGELVRAGRHPRNHGLGIGRRILLRLAPRRALQQLPPRPLPRRHPLGPRLQPWRDRLGTRLPRASRLCRPPAVGGAEERRRQRSTARARRRAPRRARSRSRRCNPPRSPSCSV